MSKLTCHVTSCASNSSNCCCQPAIKVQGKGACCCSETECQSFQRKGPSEVSNATHFDAPNQNCEIKCTAERCIYTTQGSCTANQVNIGGYSAQERCETNCESFQAR